MDQADIPALLSRLSSDEDAARKMAVFKLQSSINDPAFADVFISSGGLVVLRRLIMGTAGNTLAYALQSLSRLLEVDMGWDVFEGRHASDLVERVVELVVTNPLVNILRGAMSILVALVARSQSTGATGREGEPQQQQQKQPPPPPGYSGFRALKPAVAVYPQFFELVIQQLQSADHALCANALMLINALIRDAISADPASSPSWMSTAAPAPAQAPAPASAPPPATANKPAKGAAAPQSLHLPHPPHPPPAEEWSKFIKRLQDLGLIRAVYAVMRSSSLQDLAPPLLEFQSLTKALLRRWREVKVELERPEHRRGLKSLHLASAPDRARADSLPQTAAGDRAGTGGSTAGSRRESRRHNPEKWRRLGFETESPGHEFDSTGFLGMMDLTDYVRKNEDSFRRLLQEQAARPMRERCPVARASLAVTMVLYAHFEVDQADPEEAAMTTAIAAAASLARGQGSPDGMFRPLLLQWSRLHTVGLQAFFRIWKVTGAERADFDRVVDLLRILIGCVVGQASRTKDVVEVEEELLEHDVGRLRELQMESLDATFEENWGPHLRRAREELRQEALQFVKEQRIRCLLQGAWFAKPVPPPRRREDRPSGDPDGGGRRRLMLYTPTPWRFARLSHNRRFLHYADFEDRPEHEPGLDALTERIDLGTVSSVVSNVSAGSGQGEEARGEGGGEDGEGDEEEGAGGWDGGSTPRPGIVARSSTLQGSTKITIYSHSSSRVGGGGGGPSEEAVLALFPASHSLASEWLDGLLMLLGQTPITSETSKLVNLVRECGLRIRLLNVRVEAAHAGPPPGAGVVPSREGLDEDYFYEM